MPLAGQILQAGRIPGERIATTRVTSNSGDFTTSQAVVMSVTGPLVAGRTYGIHAFVRFSGVDNEDIGVRILEDGIGGSQLQSLAMEMSVDDQETWGESRWMYAEYTAPANEDKTFVITAQVIAGSGPARLLATASRPCYMYIEYIEG